MRQPLLKYSVIRFRKQNSSDCMVYAFVNMFEKLLQMRGFDVKLDPEALETKIRTHLQDFENGLEFPKVKEYLRNEGIEGYKMESCMFRKVDPDIIYSELQKAPLIAIMKTFFKTRERVDSHGFYKLGIQERKEKHLVCLWGYDGGFLVLDSNYDYLTKVKDEHLTTFFSSIYKVTLK